MRNISISCMQMFINIISREYISASQNPFRPFMSFPEKNVCYHICLNVVNFCLGYFCQHYLYVIIYKEKGFTMIITFRSFIMSLDREKPMIPENPSWILLPPFISSIILAMLYTYFIVLTSLVKSLVSVCMIIDQIFFLIVL